MEVEDPEVTQLELKYCERCGSLWLRLRDARRDQEEGQKRLQDFHGERWWTSKRPTVKLRREGERLPTKDPCIWLGTSGAKALTDFARLTRR